MVKSELIERLADRAGITLFKAEELVDLYFNSMSNTLCKGGRVEIRGFGAFSVIRGMVSSGFRCGCKRLINLQGSWGFHRRGRIVL